MLCCEGHKQESKDGPQNGKNIFKFYVIKNFYMEFGEILCVITTP